MESKKMRLWKMPWIGMYLRDVEKRDQRRKYAIAHWAPHMCDDGTRSWELCLVEERLAHCGGYE